jgi:acyl carrier protein
MPDRQEIVKKVTTCLVDALSVDEDEVSLEASLTRDLGAESIDFLDIIFRLEKSFAIKIPRGDLIPEDLTTNAAFAKIPADQLNALLADKAALAALLQYHVIRG